MRPTRILMALVLALLSMPILSNGATLILERVTTWSDGTPIPEELVNTIRYRYYYADNGVGPFIEGTATIDNLLVSVPELSPDVPRGDFTPFIPGHPYFYTVEAEHDGVKSGKAEPKQVAKIPEPLPLNRSSGCSMVN
jgi:hypothetical protein